MFGKKDKSALVSHVDDSRSIVRNFRRRSPFESYRSMDYRLYSKLQEKSMYPLLDRCLENLLPGADDGNLNMLNSKLVAIGLQSMVNLEQQRLNHQDVIHRLAARRTADHYDLVQMMEAETRNLQSLLEEHEKTCKQVEKGEV